MIQFDIKRILYSTVGRIMLSMLLGLGLASLFHQVCKDKNCIHFNGPVIKEVDQKTFAFDDKCYQYEAVPVTCDDKNKKIIDFANSKNTMEETFTIDMPARKPTVKGFDSSSMAVGGAEFTTEEIL